MCKCMEVSVSGYYKYLKRCRCSDETLRDAIAEVQRSCGSTYGYRRMKIAIRRETGQNVNHKRLLRVMRKYKLQSRIRRRFAYSRSKYSLRKYDNLYKQNFTATAINQKWTTDISYVLTPEGTLFLSVIKDVYDGFVVGYKYSLTQDLRLVSDTVKNAVKTAADLYCNAGCADMPINAVLHSDQGFQYTTQSYCNLLKNCGLKPSMSRKSTPLDNAPAESFFSAFKSECIYLHRPKSLDDAAKMTDAYIEFYNYRRIRLKNNGTPYEMRLNAMRGAQGGA